MKKLFLAAILWAGMSGAVWAKTVEEMLLASLESQGYVIVEQGYTFLGRLRIVAINDEIRREIVVHPVTGEILRDYAVPLPLLADTDAGKNRNRPTQTASPPSAGEPATTETDQPAGGVTVGVSGGVGAASNVTTTLGGARNGLRGTLDGYSLDGNVVVDAVVLDPVFQVEAAGQ